MTKKPPLWGDLLLTMWVLVVAVFYFGGYFLPARIGAYIQLGAALYALMLLVSAGTLAWNYLHRTDTKSRDTKSRDTKSAANEDGAKKDKTNSSKGHAHED